MAKPQKDRNRAFYLRKKQRSGIELSLDEVQWLDDYNGSKKGRVVSTATGHASTATGHASALGARAREDETGAPEGAPSNPPMGGAQNAAEARSRVQQGWGEVRRLESPSQPAPVQGQASATTGHCDIPDCPKCKAVAGAMTCGVTGENVWPPMSIEAAESMAAGLLYVLAIAFRFVRRDKAYIAPTDDEKRRLAMGIREMQIRRVSWFGAVSDLTLVGGALAGYSMRAMMTPERKPLPPPTRAEEAKPSPERQGGTSEPEPKTVRVVGATDAA